MTVDTERPYVPAISGSRVMRRAVHAEWVKLRSLRSSTWTLAATVAVTLALGAILCAVAGHDYAGSSAADRATWDPTNQSLAGTIFGQLAVAVFGVLAVTSEYASGTIRTSLAALPNRRRFVAAKTAVYGGAALLVGELASFAVFFLGQAIMSASAPTASLTDPGVLRAIVMVGVYDAVVCLIGMGLGFLLRHTAGAVTAVVALLLVLPTIVSALPSSIRDSAGQLVPPMIAGSSVGAVVRETHALSPWVGMAVLLAYAAVMIGAGARVLGRRDV